MNQYEEQIELFTRYFKTAECDEENKKLGLEVEHFVVEKDTMSAVTFGQNDGIEDLLKTLALGDWQPEKESGRVIGLVNDRAYVTLEPGGQVELSILPQNSIQDVEKIYLDFVNEVTSILGERGQTLLCLGYQPETKVSDLPLLPKERYEYMYDYFKSKGRYAHNMMKGTGAIHVNLDFTDEGDYRKKNLVANFLAPLVYTVLDNSPFFEGEVCESWGLRRLIWENCDSDRSGYPPGLFDKPFGYREYAQYLLSAPPMVYKKANKLVYSKHRLLKDILLRELNPTGEELEYILTTVFPDVRTKDHLELRMGDSLPYPYSLAYLAFWKGLFYNGENLDTLYKRYKVLTVDDFLQCRREVSEEGLGATWLSGDVFSAYRDLLTMAERGLCEGERKYLAPLTRLTREGIVPKQKTLDSLSGGKDEALAWCNLNRVTEGRNDR